VTGYTRGELVAFLKDAAPPHHQSSFRFHPSHIEAFCDCKFARSGDSLGTNLQDKIPNQSDILIAQSILVPKVGVTNQFVK